MKVSRQVAAVLVNIKIAEESALRTAVYLFDERISLLDEPVLIKWLDITVSAHEFKEKFKKNLHLTKNDAYGTYHDESLVLEYDKITQFMYDWENSQFSLVASVRFSHTPQPRSIGALAVVSEGLTQFLIASDFYAEDPDAAEQTESKKLPSPTFHHLKILNLLGNSEFKVQLIMHHESIEKTQDHVTNQMVFQRRVLEFNLSGLAPRFN